MSSKVRFFAVAVWLALGPAWAVAQSEKPASSPERFVFVPYEKTTGPQIGKQQSVLLPYAEFLRLKSAAEKRPLAAEFKPLASLSQSRYQGQTEGDLARLDAEFVIETLARPDDALEIHLPFQGASIESAAVDGEQASFGPLEQEMGLRVFLTGPGRRTVRLRLAAPIQSDGAVRRLDFRVPRAAASSLRLSLREDVVLEPAEGALPATISKSADGASTIDASAGSADRLLVVYRTRMEATGAAAETRIAVQQSIRFSVFAQSASARVTMKMEPLAGSARDVAVEIPKNARLLSVSGPFVKDWSAPDAQGKTTVALVREAREPFELALDLELPAPEPNASLALPEFRVPQAVRESGEIVVVPDEGLSVWAEEIAGLESVSLSAGEKASARGFRFAQPGWRLALSRRPIPARIRSQGILLYEATEDLLRLKSRHHLSVSGRGIFALAFEVPEGFELSEAGPADLVSGYRQQGRRVEVNLQGEKLGSIAVDLRLQQPRRPAGKGPSARTREIALAPIQIVGAEEDSGHVALAAPLALRVSELKSSGLEAADVRQLQKDLEPLLSPELTPALAYRYFAPAFLAEASIEPQRTRLTCETALLVSITPSLMRLDAALNYNVEFSAIDEFQFLVPAAAGEDVQIRGADIKEKKRAAPAPNDALTTWTIRLQRRVIGPYALSVSFDSPLPGAESGKPLRVAVPTVSAANVARETGYIAVARGENLEVRVAKAEELERRDVKELPASLSSASLGFRYFDPRRRALELELVRHELESVLGALIRRLHIETVLNDQREAVHEAIFEIQNNREQYLELKLPEGMQIWSAFVRGAPTPSTTRQSDGAKLIELTKSESLDSAFRVRLYLRQTLPGGDMGRRGRIDLAPIRPLNIPVLRTTWKLYLPEDYRYIKFSGSMEYDPGDRPPWIEPAAEKLLNDFPAEMAGGIAQPTLNPPQEKPSLAYETTETEQEKRVRLGASALEIPIVRKGLRFEFSKLSGVGDIQVHYWKRKPLLLTQGAVGLILFAVLIASMGIGKRLWIGLAATLVCFIGASLTDGMAGRLLATAFLSSAAAAVLICVVYIFVKHPTIRMKAAAPPSPPKSDV